MFIRPVLIGIRDVKLFLADKGDLAFSLLLPIALLTLMLAAFPDQTEINMIAYLADADGGPAAREVVGRLDGVPGLRLTVLSDADARERLDDAEILLYARIPPGYSAALAAGEAPPAIEIHRRGNGGQEGQIFTGYVTDAADRVAAAALLGPSLDAIIAGAAVDVPAGVRTAALSRTLGEAEADPPVRTESETAGDDNGLGVQMFPNLATMFVVFAITLSASAFVEERRRGTVERLLTTRLTLGELFAGTFLGNLFRGLLQLTVLFLLGAAAFGFFELRVLGLGLLFSVVVVSAAASLALLLASVARTPDQVRWGAIFLTALMSVFGGTFAGAGDLGALTVPAHFTVNYWANQGFHDLLIRDAGFVDLLAEGSALAATAVVALAISRVLLRPSGMTRR